MNHTPFAISMKHPLVFPGMDKEKCSQFGISNCICSECGFSAVTKQKKQALGRAKPGHLHSCLQTPPWKQDTCSTKKELI